MMYRMEKSDENITAMMNADNRQPAEQGGSEGLPRWEAANFRPHTMRSNGRVCTRGGRAVGKFAVMPTVRPTGGGALCDKAHVRILCGGSVKPGSPPG